MLIGSGCHRSSEWRDRLARAALRQLSPANSYSYRRLSDDLPGRPASEGANNSMSMDSKATTTSKTKAASSQYPLGTAAQTRLRLLAALATKARVRSNGDYEVKHCNLCDKPNKEKLDNLWKLLIRPDCSYYCYRCACGGGSSNMKLILSKKGIELPKIGSIDTKALFVSSSKSVTLSVVDSKSAATKNTVNGQTAKKGSAVSKAPVVYAIPNQAQSCSYITSLFPQSLTTSLTNHAAGLHVVDGNQSLEEEKLRDNRRNSFLISARQVPSARQAVMEYLTKERALSPEILQRYGVGCATVAFIDENDQWKEQLCVSFPWTRPIKDVIDNSLFSVPTNNRAYLSADGSYHYVVRNKFRSLITKGRQRIYPTGGCMGLFGWHLIKPNHKKIIITEGEYDAMAIAQAISQKKNPFYGVPVVSLPNGCNSLPDIVAEMLAPFDRICLWMDSDKAGQTGAVKMAKKLGVKRCYSVLPDPKSEFQPKDANDAIRISYTKERSLVIDLIQQAQHMETMLQDDREDQPQDSSKANRL